MPHGDHDRRDSPSDYLTFLPNKQPRSDLPPPLPAPPPPSSHDSNGLFPVLMLFIACVFFSMMQCLVRLAIREFNTPVMYLTFYCGIAGGVLCSTSLIALKKPMYSTSTAWATGLVTFRSMFGALAIMFDYAALQRLPVGVTTCLYSMNPVITSIMGWMFLNERLTFVNYVVLALVTVGAVLVGLAEPFDMTSMSSNKHFEGIVFCLLMAFSTACIYVIMRHLGEEASLIGTELASCIWIVSLTVSSYWILYGSRLTMSFFVKHTLDMSLAAHVVLLGISICNFCASLLFNYGTRSIRADKSAVVMTCEIPLGFIMAFIMLREFPTSLLEISGCALIFVAAYVIAVKGGS